MNTRLEKNERKYWILSLSICFRVKNTRFLEVDVSYQRTQSELDFPQRNMNFSRKNRLKFQVPKENGKVYNFGTNTNNNSKSV